LGEYYVLLIWHTFYQHRDDLIPKFSWQKNNFSYFGKVSKLAAVKFFSQLHMLVDFKYPFLCESLGLEIFHTCNQYMDGLMPKTSCEFKKKMSIFRRMSKWAVVKWFLIATHVGRF